MKREIKFRVWDSDRKKWVKFLTYCIDDFSISNKEWHLISQYTGLKDKNGKEIYEGDVVRKDTYSIGYCLPIVWRDSMFQLGHSGISPIYDLKDYEIIGNIYENPELINQ